MTGHFPCRYGSFPEQFDHEQIVERLEIATLAQRYRVRILPLPGLGGVAGVRTPAFVERPTQRGNISWLPYGVAGVRTPAFVERLSAVLGLSPHVFGVAGVRTPAFSQTHLPPPLLPIAVYDGDTPWQAPLRMSDFIGTGLRRTAAANEATESDSPDI